MGIVLRRMGRSEIVSRLKTAAGLSPAGLVSLARSGNPESIVKVVETGRGVFLCPFERRSPILKLAPFMGSDVHEFGVSELADRLSSAKSDDVWLQWPVDDPCICVGTVTAVMAAGGSWTCLAPVPADIEEVNEEVRRRASPECPKARSGMQCGDCGEVAACPILERIDKEITSERDKGKDRLTGDAGEVYTAPARSPGEEKETNGNHKTQGLAGSACRAPDAGA